MELPVLWQKGPGDYKVLWQGSYREPGAQRAERNKPDLLHTARGQPGRGGCPRGRHRSLATEGSEAVRVHYESDERVLKREVSWPDLYLKMNPWRKCFKMNITKSLERMRSIYNTHALTTGGKIN